MTEKEILDKLRELDGRMMRLPIGQCDAEYDTLEVAYNKLRADLQEEKNG